LDQKSEAEVGSINVPEYGYPIIHDAYSGVFHIMFSSGEKLLTFLPFSVMCI